jgi:hypothetical protein
MSKRPSGRVVVNDDKDNPLHFKMQRLAELNNMEFPIQLTSSTTGIAAKAWDSFRLSFIRKVGDALSLICDSVEIFRALLVSTSNVDTGDPKLNAFLLELVEDTFLNLNSLFLPATCSCASSTSPLLKVPMASRNSHPRSLGIVYLNGNPAWTSYSWPRRLRVPTLPEAG